MSLVLRVATREDAPALVRLINAAYRVERFFIRGDRTNQPEVETLIGATDACFLCLGTEDGELAGCGYARVSNRRGHLGFLAVDPRRQGQGLGKRLVLAVEDHCAAAGCEALDLDVFNVRTELPPFYSALGFVATNTGSFDHPELLLQPAHLIRMSKPLGR